MVLSYQKKLYGILKVIPNLLLNLWIFDISRIFNNLITGFGNIFADHGYYIDFENFIERLIKSGLNQIF